MSILTLLEILPLIGSLVLAFLPKDNSKLIKQIALVTSLVVAILSIWMATQFDTSVSGFQFTESRSWISAFNINYAVGIDGMALALIVMSTVLVPIVFLAGWHESEGGRFSVKTFYLLMLVLETMMIGVFAATDVFLFYVIFEAMLIPMYLIIGVWGGSNRVYAAIKFFLYTLFGSLLMLVALIYLYYVSNQTFEIFVNNESVKSGSLLENFEPPVNPPKEIDDPEDKKPEDWVDVARIPDPDAKKPKTVSLFKSMSPGTMDFETALKLLSLPRVVGQDPETGTDITAQNGKFGPYLLKGKESRSLQTEEQIFDITLEGAVALFAQPKLRGRVTAATPLKEFGEDPADRKSVV